MTNLLDIERLRPSAGCGLANEDSFTHVDCWSGWQPTTFQIVEIERLVSLSRGVKLEDLVTSSAWEAQGSSSAINRNFRALDRETSWERVLDSASLNFANESNADVGVAWVTNEDTFTWLNNDIRAAAEEVVFQIVVGRSLEASAVEREDLHTSRNAALDVLEQLANGHVAFIAQRIGNQLEAGLHINVDVANSVDGEDTLRHRGGDACRAERSRQK